MKQYLVDTIGGQTMLVKAVSPEKARKKALQALGKHTGLGREATDEEVRFAKQFWKIADEREE